MDLFSKQTALVWNNVIFANAPKLLDQTKKTQHVNGDNGLSRLFPWPSRCNQQERYDLQSGDKGISDILDHRLQIARAPTFKLQVFFAFHLNSHPVFRILHSISALTSVIVVSTNPCSRNYEQHHKYHRSDSRV